MGSLLSRLRELKNSLTGHGTLPSNLVGDLDGNEEGIEIMEEEWREIGLAEELAKKSCQRVYAETSNDEDLVLVAVNKKFSAMSTWCSHMGGPLHSGNVIEYKEKKCLQCPWHGYMFDIEDGVHPDIGIRQEVFETCEKDGKVYIRYPKSKLSLEPFDN